MNEFWFRPKTYGYGATPITWEGWTVTVVAVIAVVATWLLILDHETKNPWAWMAFFAIEVVILAALWIVSRRKTLGEWRWRWGDRHRG